MSLIRIVPSNVDHLVMYDRAMSGLSHPSQFPAFEYFSFDAS
jgi:hypothetical protein